MTTFELTLSDTYQDILKGKPFVAFDVVSATTIEVVFTETPETPTGAGNNVLTYGDDWDFASSGLASEQRIWVRGAGAIRGIR